MYGQKVNKKFIWKVVAAIVVVVALLIFGITSCVNNTASGQRFKKGVTSEFNKGLEREITVFNADGKIIYEKKGKFDIDYKEGRLQYVDQKNMKHNIYIGYNATVIVDELE